MKNILTAILLAIQYCYSCLIWFTWWTIAVILILLLLPLSVIIPKKHYDPFVHLVCKILTYSALLFPKVDKKHYENIPFPVIYVGNHVSFFDLFISGTVLPGNPRGLELKEHFATPVYGWFITRFGQIPIDARSKSSIRDSFKRATAILKTKERNLFVMPEGTRTITGHLNKFKPGAFYLSKKSGVPIVPVLYKNLFKRKNKNSIIIKPGTFDVLFLPPVYPDDFKTDVDMARYVQNIMTKKLQEKD